MSDKTPIRIECEGAALLPLEDFTELQGELKSLSVEDYQRLRDEIRDRGFSFTVHVWRDQGKHWILDGHQRLRTVKRMVEAEGYSCASLPVSFVNAKSYQEAKHKLLAATSQYGRIEKQGLYEFLADIEMKPADLERHFRFPEVDLPKFDQEFFSQEPAADEPPKEGSQEFSEGEFQEFEHTCPRCSFQFNSKK